MIIPIADLCLRTIIPLTWIVLVRDVRIVDKTTK